MCFLSTQDRSRRCGTFRHKAADCLKKKADDQKQARYATSTKTPKKFKGNCYYLIQNFYNEMDRLAFSVPSYIQIGVDLNTITI